MRYKLVHKSGSVHSTGTKEECLAMRAEFASCYYMNYRIEKVGNE